MKHNNQLINIHARICSPFHLLATKGLLCRRSSMSVLTLTVWKTERRKRKFFPRTDATPQSRTAVHYLVNLLSNFYLLRAALQVQMSVCLSVVQQLSWVCLNPLSMAPQSFPTLPKATKGVPWAWLQIHKFAWSSISLHSSSMRSLFLWAVHKNFEVLVISPLVN